MQVVEWYDELVRLTDSPVVRLNRAVAVGRGRRAACRPGRAGRARPVAAPAHRGRGLPAREGRRPGGAARLYALAARQAPSVAERDHLTRQAARLNADPALTGWRGFVRRRTDSPTSETSGVRTRHGGTPETRSQTCASRSSPTSTPTWSPSRRSSPSRTSGRPTASCCSATSRLGPVPVESLDLLASLGDRAVWVHGNCEREVLAAYDGTALESPERRDGDRDRGAAAAAPPRADRRAAADRHPRRRRSRAGAVLPRDARAATTSSCSSTARCRCGAGRSRASRRRPSSWGTPTCPSTGSSTGVGW